MSPLPQRAEHLMVLIPAYNEEGSIVHVIDGV